MEKDWYLYILRCGDDTLYTGISTDVDARFRRHAAGKGAKYTRGRGPLTLACRFRCGSHSDALREEYRVKRLSRADKECLIRHVSRQEEDPEISE